MTRALYIIMAAMLAVVVPVSQLRTVSVRIDCCCPDPDQCHCPDDAKPVPGQPSMRPCHRSTDIIAGSLLSELDAPRRLQVDAPHRRVVAALFTLPAPHPPPSPARPPAPS